ncbi:PREDICTED: POC1 centriolar protein homolog [Rhagoletis zephyria]|uniref:POC1 centriolar protein homolog n=1 Tax=Rhagoletis zephyria TaxID=28612 RepID=UPI0008116C22|nr:PREDICTED: POC1 centriolar protein homolog [Rhagoletis zephyria]
MANSHQNTDSKYTSFTGHRKWVRAAKFSPNGECVRTFTVGRGMGRQLAWHPDVARLEI